MMKILFQTHILPMALGLATSISLSAQNYIDLNTLPDVVDIEVVRTNPGADTVIIGLHGGPTDDLEPGDFSFFESIPTFSVVEVRQFQHLHPSILNNSAMTLGEAIVYNDTTVALLRKVVNHYVAQNRVVVLIGHSFGAFILTEYADDYGLDDLHRIVPMAGRMNMPDTIWHSFEAGVYADFLADGVTPQFDQSPASPSDWASMKLQAGLGYNRWIDSLAGMDLSKLMYVYGTNDQAVGSLDPNEVNMLNMNSATVLGIAGGSHSAPFFTPNITQVLAFIRGPIVADIQTAQLSDKQVNIYPSVVLSDVTVETTELGALRIYNSGGALVLQEQLMIGKQRVDLNALSSGFYLAHFISADERTFIQKLHIQ